jgi:hypothetical protein
MCMLTYKKEHARAAYVPDAKIGDSPPYKKQILIGFQDPNPAQPATTSDIVE